MGTSQRHKASVLNQPNWGKTSNDVTAIVKTIIAAQDFASNPPGNWTVKQIAKKQNQYEKRISSCTRKSVRNIVKAAGGRKKVASGNSKAIGHFGVGIGLSWASTMAELNKVGIEAWLESKGIKNFADKSCHDIINIIESLIEEDVIGLDATAAGDALQHVMELVEAMIGDDLDNFDSTINKIMSTEQCSIMICEFFGYYIYSHLSQDFSEKLEKKYGTDNKDATLSEIRDKIIADAKNGYKSKSVLNIDWNGPEGDNFIKEEFDSILYIIGCDDED